MGNTKPDTSLRLRTIPLIAFVIEFFLAIPFAIAVNRIAPAIGLIALAGSCLLSLMVLRGKGFFKHWFRGANYEYRIVLDQDEPHKDDSSMRTSLLLLADVFLGFSSAAIYSGSIVEMMMGGGWYSRADGNILGTYAGLPYLAVMVTHGWLAFLGMCKLAKRGKKSLDTCPHCQKSLVFPGSPKAAGVETQAEENNNESPSMSGAGISAV
ncbi:hypothetical protein BT63DRAFT_425257 [Microthyrium microscopicum]|uniref:Uncharacterized protein n=1 Tax=Microthyrium microscopicum TaxID=703497 RepID=A0A6A6UD48_9PEZI|nr:hypothetical protein BT63DRAFT_425257 [Microthyrium microscopicum]